MGSSAIDYAALAQQARQSAPVDYAALAEQARKAAAPAPEGFWHSLGAQFGITPEAAEAAAKDSKDHPIKTFLENALGPAYQVGKGLYEQGKESGSQIVQSSKAFKNHNQAEEFSHLVQAVPILGPAMVKAASQAPATTGNYAHDVLNAATDLGTMGTLVGASANAAPLVAGAIESVAPRALPAAAEAVKVPFKAAANAPRAAVDAAARVVAGSKLDTPIPGDTITYRQRFEAAKNMGVNLDTAQATGGAVANAVKRPIEHSLGGTAKFEDNNAANSQALHAHADAILNSADPTPMMREEFGNLAKEKLIQDQRAKYDQAGKIYQDLSDRNGVQQPDASGIKDMARHIQADNAEYYAAHPELLRGGAGSAWKIVQDLAGKDQAPPTVVRSSIVDEAGQPYTSERAAPAPRKDTWSDLQKMRTDLLDQIRQPDLVGSRAEGWLKQLTGKIDEAMTNPETSGLQGEDLQKFRDANAVWQRMKSTYDDPQSPLYHVVRARDGLTAANTLASLKPEFVRQIGEVAPDLVPQLQRQAISRILNPTDNALPDLKNLPSRLSRVQKEQLSGILTPQQLTDLQNLSRVSRVVNLDANPSGSGKTLQAHGELSAAAAGAGSIATGLATANPALVIGGAAPPAWIAASRIASKAMTNPEFTEAVVNSTRGRAAWVDAGAVKMASHAAADSSAGFSPAAVAALKNTPQGQQILIKASSLKPGSPMMKTLAKQAAATLHP